MARAIARLDRRDFILGSGALLGAAAMRPGWAFAADGDTARFRVSADLTTLDPMSMIGGVEEVIMRCVYASLVRVGDIRAGSPLSNHAAETIEQIDPQTIKFTLMEGLTWTNGFGPVTPEDVKYSFERIANPDNASAWAYQFEQLETVEVLDDRSGLIKLKKPFQPFWVISLPWYGGHIVCKEAVEKAGGKIATDVLAACGPYVLEKWDPNQKVVLAQNPDWPGAKPDFQKIEIYVVGDDEGAAAAFEANAFDYTRVAVGSAPAIKEKLPGGSKLIETQSTTYVWLTLNVENPSLADPKVRQAVQYAYDSQSVLAGVYNDLVPRSTGVVQPGSAFARPKNTIDTYDPEKARALLAEAGKSDLTLQLWTTNDSTDLATAQVIQAGMAAAGITVEIQSFEEGTYWTLGDQNSGEAYKDLQLCLMKFAGGIDPSENLVWFRPDQVGVYNWSRWNSPEFEALYQELISAGNTDERAEISHKMEDLMEQSGAFIFICHEPLVALHRDFLEPVVLADGHPNPATSKKV